MKFDDYEEKLNEIKRLIQNSNTGSPQKLAKQLNVSERTIRRLIEKLKLKGRSIKFCRRSNSYVLEKD